MSSAHFIKHEAHIKGLIQTLNKEADITIKNLAVWSGIVWMASQFLNTKGIWEGDWELQRKQEGHREKNKKEEGEALGNNDPLSINIKGYVTISHLFLKKKKKSLYVLHFV